MKPAGGIRTAKDAIQYLVVLYETLGPRWMTPGLVPVRCVVPPQRRPDADREGADRPLPGPGPLHDRLRRRRGGGHDGEPARFRLPSRRRRPGPGLRHLAAPEDYAGDERHRRTRSRDGRGDDFSRPTDSSRSSTTTSSSCDPTTDVPDRRGRRPRSSGYGRAAWHRGVDGPRHLRGASRSSIRLARPGWRSRR